jgi:UDP-glucose 4-epimerase
LNSSGDGDAARAVHTESRKEYTRVGVTGAAGFIGSHLCERLLGRDVEVVAVDDLSAGTSANLAGCIGRKGFTLDVFDCSDPVRLSSCLRGCDVIVHLAGKKIPRYGQALATLDTNALGARAACRAALATDADLILTSTSDVYGNAPAPMREDSALVLGPSTSRRWGYAVSMLYNEHAALALADEDGLRVTILRLFGSYGPRNHPSWWGGPQAAFFEALLDGRPMEIHGDGRQVRSFTYVDDTVEGILRAIGCPAARGSIFNIGRVAPTAIVELAAQVQDALGFPAPLRVRYVPYEAIGGNYQDVRKRVPAIGKAREILGFDPRVPLSVGLERTAAWHLGRRRQASAGLAG